MRIDIGDRAPQNRTGLVGAVLPSACAADPTSSLIGLKIPLAANARSVPEFDQVQTPSPRLVLADGSLKDKSPSPGRTVEAGPGETPPKSARPHTSKAKSPQPGARGSGPSSGGQDGLTAAGGKWPDWPWNLRSPRAGGSRDDYAAPTVLTLLVHRSVPARRQTPGR